VHDSEPQNFPVVLSSSFQAPLANTPQENHPKPAPFPKEPYDRYGAGQITQLQKLFETHTPPGFHWRKENLIFILFSIWKIIIKTN
jgi:hypothetical protein